MKQRNVLYLLPILLMLGAIGYGINYYNDKAFEGTDSVMLINEYDQISSFKELINRKEFKNKVLYIDLWGVYCGPCLKEFGYASELKSRYKNRPVEFLYLATPYNRIDDEQKWKSAIKKYNLEGHHVLMSSTFYKEIWNEIPDMKDRFVIPHHLLVDQNGKIVQPNAPKPSDKQKLYSAIDPLIL